MKMRKRTFFSFCPLLVLIFSCGKKIQDGGGSKSETEVQRPTVELPETIELLTSIPQSSPARAIASNATEDFVIPHNGFITIPHTLNTLAQNLRQHLLRFYVNVDRAGKEEFSCLWDYAATTYRFRKCVDSDGVDLGLAEDTVGNFPFPIDKNSRLRLKIENAGNGNAMNAKANIPVHSWN